MCLMVGGVFFSIEQTRISVSGLTSRKQKFAGGGFLMESKEVDGSAVRLVESTE